MSFGQINLLLLIFSSNIFDMSNFVDKSSSTPLCISSDMMKNSKKPKDVPALVQSKLPCINYVLIAGDTEQSIYFGYIKILSRICSFRTQKCLRKVCADSSSSKAFSLPFINYIRIISWYFWGNFLKNLLYFFSFNEWWLVFLEHICSLLPKLLGFPVGSLDHFTLQSLWLNIGCKHIL